jgi:hypothetical protein
MKCFILLLLGAIVGCSTTRTATTTDHGRPDTARSASPKPARFVFSFYLSGSGGGEKPQDSWTIDTAGLMSIKAVTMDKPGHWNSINGMAFLDVADRDTLVSILQKGKLWLIDSTDINEQCAGDELYNIIIAVPDQPKHLHATFQECAADYNLLLEPQRAEFKHLIEWFARMRVKYRPAAP